MKKLICALMCVVMCGVWGVNSNKFNKFDPKLSIQIPTQLEEEGLNNHTVGFCSNCPSSSTVRQPVFVCTCTKFHESVNFTLPLSDDAILRVDGHYEIYPYGQGEALCYECILKILAPKCPVQFVPPHKDMSLPDELLSIQTLKDAIHYLKSGRPVSCLTTQSSSIQYPNPCLKTMPSGDACSAHYQIVPELEGIYIEISIYRPNLFIPIIIEISVTSNNKEPLEINIEDSGEIQELASQKPFICSDSTTSIRLKLGGIDGSIELQDFDQQFNNVSVLMIAVTKLVNQLNIPYKYDEQQIALDLQLIYDDLMNQVLSGKFYLVLQKNI